MNDTDLRKFALEMAIKADPTDAVALAEKYYAFLTTRANTANYAQSERQMFQPSQNWAKP